MTYRLVKLRQNLRMAKLVGCVEKINLARIELKAEIRK